MSFRNGGWVILLAAVVFVILGTWQIRQLMDSRGAPRVGDGTNPATYGFTLEPSLVDMSLVSGIGVSKDGVAPLDYPTLVAGADHKTVKIGMRGSKYLVRGDRVIGVVRNGHARAYPLNVMAWHTVVNDTVGGDPIAITYAPLCDAAVVFDRRVNDEVVEFGFSGLVYNYNELLYDRRALPEEESLWSQLGARAVIGPAAGTPVTVAPFQVMHWVDWLERHPDTTLLKPSPKMALKYIEAPYTSYLGNDLLRRGLPIASFPEPEMIKKKTPALVVMVEADTKLLPLPTIAKAVDSDGVWRTLIGGRPLEIVYRDGPPCAFVNDIDDDVTVIPTFWFAWAAMEAAGG